MSKPTLSDAMSGPAGGEGNPPPPQRGESDAAAEATGEAGSETVRANFNIPEPLHARFKHVCRAEGRDMTWVVKKLMRQWIRERDDGL